MPRQPAATPRNGRAAGQDGHHRDAQDGKRQQLRRAEIEHHRPQDRNRHREQHGAEDAAHHRRHVGGAERAAGLAALRHREAVKHRCRGGCTSGHAEQDCGNRIAGGGGGAKAEQQREGGVGVHAEGERQQHRGAGEAADAGHDAEHEPHHAAGHQIHQPMRFHQRDEGLAGRRRHEGRIRSNAFHRSRRLPGLSGARSSSLGFAVDGLAVNACRARSIRCGGVA